MTGGSPGDPSPVSWRLSRLFVLLMGGAIVTLPLATWSIEPDSRLVVPVAHGVLLGAVGLWVAWLLLRAYLVRGTSTLLLLAVAMILWAGGGTAAGILMLWSAMNDAVTVFNVTALGAGACQVLGAISSAAGGLTGRRARTSGGSAALAVVGALAVIAATIVLGAVDLLPTFWQGGASTPLRFAVLAVAITEFALAALFFTVLHTKVRQLLFGWYALGSMLIALGLSGALLASDPTHAVGWAGRLALYAGTAYLLVAVLTAGTRFRRAGVGLGRSVALSFEEAEMAYRPLVEAAGEALLSLDDAGRVLFSNRAAQDLLARSRAELFALPLEQLGATRADVESLARVLAAVRDPDQERSSRHTEVRLNRPAGALSVPAEVVVVSRLGVGAAPFVAVVRDLTPRQAVEAALRSANQRLERRVAERTRELEELTEGLEERVSAATVRAQEQAQQLRRLAAELTTAELRERRRLAALLHDHLQQLLVAAKLNLVTVRREAPGAGAVDRLAELLDEAIQAARSLAVEISPPVLERGGLAHALVWLARWEWEHHGLEVQLERDDEIALPSQEAQALLFQAAREMLFNVVKHAGVMIAELRLQQRDGLVEIVVSDRGVGFNPAVVEDPEGGGTGLGLQSLRDRLTGLGGGLELTSNPAGGTTARAYLPATRSPARTGREHSGAIRSLAPDAVRVLLVDAQPVVREGLAALLRSYGIAVVGQGADSRTAIELAQRLRPQVVLIDVDEPRLDGVAATRHLCQTLPEVAVVGLATSADEHLTSAMRSAGAAACIAKDVDTERLVEVIRAGASSRPA